MKNEYRILERQGLFYIEVKETKIIPPTYHLTDFNPLILTFIWPYLIWYNTKHKNDKPKIIESWHRVSDFGTRAIYGYFTILAIPPFTSLESAKHRVELFNTPDKIHNLN